jgi:hypothetical protein
MQAICFPKRRLLLEPQSIISQKAAFYGPTQRKDKSSSTLELSLCTFSSEAVFHYTLVGVNRTGSQPITSVVILTSFCNLYFWSLISHLLCTSVNAALFPPWTHDPETPSLSPKSPFESYVPLKDTVFWYATPCGSYKNRRFGRTYRLKRIGDLGTTVAVTSNRSTL